MPDLLFQKCCAEGITLTATNNTLLKSVVRQHNALAPAAIEQQQLFIIYQAYGVNSFCERNISSFQKCCDEVTTLTATNNTSSKMLCVSTTL